MLVPREHTRRSVVRACAALLSGGLLQQVFARSPSALPLQFTPAAKGCSSTWAYRRYAVHAAVMLGSIQLISKKNVGGGAIAIERAPDGENLWTAIQFVAGSSPEHLKGFNRFGATQELTRQESGVVRESGYLSFMTTSRESEMGEARKAFRSQTGSQMFTFARGRATDRGCAYTLEHRPLGTGWTWSNCAELFAQPDSPNRLPPEQPVAGYGPNCLPGFLFALQSAVMRTETRYDTSYVHNGQVFHLRTESKAEGDGSNLRLVAGKITQDGHHSEFRLWLEAKSQEPLPERIEYKPRGFLSLTLEAENSLDSPKLRPLLGDRA